MSKSIFKDKLDGNELDLSLNELTEVPVKDLALTPKATHLDLSCNKIQELPTSFASLNHLVRVDLSKNLVTELPHNFGSLVNLQYLDLYGNQLVMLPVSFCRLKSLRWLDLKNNPLDPKLKAIAGDCLDEKQCQICAKKVVSFMQTVDSDLEREKQKRLKVEREKEAARKAKEDREHEKQRIKKKAQREKRKAEQKAQNEKSERQQKHTQSPKESTEENGIAKGTRMEEQCSGSFCRSFMLFILCLLVTCGILAVGFVLYNDLTVTEFQLLIEEHLLISKDAIVVWWSAFAVPCVMNMQTSLYPWLEYFSLFNLTSAE